MFHYSNLSDFEFEALCNDIMSAKLGISLERYGTGKDNGIDLTEDALNHRIVVQVKHYIKTNVDGLITALKKEIPKVNRLSPRCYYICCSKELTPANKQSIYSMFSQYMESSKNIITAIEIDDFLKAPENIGILQKHFKLWIESTTILTTIFSQDIFIDSEAMLSNISENIKLFVTTSSYYAALDILKKKRILIIVGQPGSGKSITSQMLVLTYACNGFRVRYTSDSSDLSSLKKSISESPDTKEVILLDDCFGQAYFNMKENQGNSLQSLIKYVRMHPSKTLIMNSRITIYHEARELSTGLWRSYDQKEFDSLLIDLDTMSYQEKAKIFYNHLFFFGLPDEYRKNILLNNNYRDIVKHQNFNPRVIEYISTKRNWITVPPYKYAQFILQSLNEPSEIWKIEYEERLAKVDRVFLMTLYSLTSTHVSADFFKNCLMHRFINMPDIDGSINHYERILLRLSESMVKILDIHGEKHIAVANPSVNDFLRTYLEGNPVEMHDIRSSICCIQQIKRLYKAEEQTERINLAFKDKSILSFIFESLKEKQDFITLWCSNHYICDACYTSYIHAFIENPHNIRLFSENAISAVTVLTKLFDKSLCSFYGLEELIHDLLTLSNILEDMELFELVEFISSIDDLFNGTLRNNYLDLITFYLLNAQEEYCDMVPVDNYDIDVNQIIDNLRHEYSGFGGALYYESVYDIDRIIDIAEKHITEQIEDEMLDLFYSLPEDIPIDRLSWCHPDISIADCDTYVNNYFKEDLDDGFDLRHDYNEGSSQNENVDKEIDQIFQV